MKEKIKVVVINKGDNVGITLSEALAAGEETVIDGKKVKAIDPIPVGHKIAVRDIPAGGWVTKFGETIGKAKSDIKVGQHVHVHNVEDITELLVQKSQEGR